MVSRDEPGGLRRHLDVCVGLLVALAAIALRVDYVRHAGALWRDEIDSVNVAALPSLGDVLAHRHLDSFPAAWVAVLHGWIAAFGAADEAVRAIGIAIGAASIAVVWWSGWRLAGRVPLVALLLLGASATMIVYGSEVRGYGLGALAIAWSMAALWRFVTAPGRWTATNALLATLAAAQTNYANAFLLVALCAGAAAVALRRRDWSRLWGVAAIGAVAAGSLLAVNHHAMAQAASDTVIDRGDYTLAARFAVFRGALAPGVPLLAALWAVAAVLGVAGWTLAWLAPAGAEPRTDGQVDRDRALFAAVTVATAVASFAVYLAFVARVSTQFWYYLSPMVVLAFAFEMGIALLARRHAVAGLATTAAVSVAAVLLAATGGAAATARLRMTNVDLIARHVTAEARPDDLVVVLPWYAATTFERYYRGAAPWIAFPDVHFTASSRPHAQVAERMTRGDAGVQPELERIERTLRAGGRVWVVGQILLPPLDRPLEPLPPAPGGPEGWASGPYLEGWAYRLGALMRTGVRDVWKIPVPEPGPVNAHESLPLAQLEGWR